MATLSYNSSSFLKIRPPFTCSYEFIKKKAESKAPNITFTFFLRDFIFKKTLFEKKNFNIINKDHKKGSSALILSSHLCQVLVGVDITAALDMYLSNGQSERAFDTAAEHGPQLLHKYLAKHVSHLIADGKTAEALPLYKKYGAPAFKQASLGCTVLVDLLASLGCTVLVDLLANLGCTVLVDLLASLG